MTVAVLLQVEYTRNLFKWNRFYIGWHKMITFTLSVLHGRFFGCMKRGKLRRIFGPIEEDKYSSGLCSPIELDHIFSDDNLSLVSHLIFAMGARQPIDIDG